MFYFKFFTSFLKLLKFDINKNIQVYSPYIDSAPRSRRPIQLYASAPVLCPPTLMLNQSEIITNGGTVASDFDLSAEQFWAPHSDRLSAASPADSEQMVTDYIIPDRNIKTPNRDSAIGKFLNFDF